MNSSKKSILEEIPQGTLLKEIGEICAAVTTVVTPKELLEISLKRTIRLFGAKRGSIFILNESGKNLTLKIAEGMKLSEQKQMVKRLGEGIVGHVAEIKKPVVVDDISRDDRFQNFKARKSYSTSSFICAPLLIKDKLIGVINISDKENSETFKEDELQLLDFLSSQIALNYRRLQLYKKFKKALEESRTLKSELGKSSKEASDLKDQVEIHEKLATIGKLAGGIAHEFNNPLDGVLRYTNLCLEYAKDDEVIRGYLLEIKHGLNRMANIVRSLLACSRSEKPSLHQINPSFAVEQALASIQSDVYHKNIKIEKNLRNQLPSLIDFGIERAVSNLLRNAVDAVDDGGTVELTTNLVDGQIFIEIKDNGCGIAEQEKEKIFEPFYTTKDMEKGCGLGLTIVSEIVKSYSGHIEVESTPKKGTKFSIWLPVKFNDESRTQ